MKSLARLSLPIVVACTRTPASASAPTEVRATEPAAEVPTARITLAELVRRCRDAGAMSDTFDEATDAALEARTIVWQGAGALGAQESERLFHAVMSAAGFTCDRVGPASLGVVRISAPQ